MGVRWRGRIVIRGLTGRSFRDNFPIAAGFAHSLDFAIRFNPAVVTPKKHRTAARAYSLFVTTKREADLLILHILFPLTRALKLAHTQRPAFPFGEICCCGDYPGSSVGLSCISWRIDSTWLNNRGTCSQTTFHTWAWSIRSYPWMSKFRKAIIRG